MRQKFLARWGVALLAAGLLLGARSPGDADSRSGRSADSGTVTWILIGGGGAQTRKAAGFQLYAASNLPDSILLVNNLLLDAGGQIATEHSVQIFTGSLLGASDRGKDLGFGIVLPYAEAEPAVQGASNCIMLGRTAANLLQEAQFIDALQAADTASVAVDQLVGSLTPGTEPPAAITAAVAAQKQWQRALPPITRLRQVVGHINDLRHAAVAIQRAENELRRIVLIVH